MPSDDMDYSIRWALIKRQFSKRFISIGSALLAQTSSHLKKHELGIGQRRFWEHGIRDDNDYWNHVHYIHYNPVKHGLVKRLEDWPYSTYQRHCQTGTYDAFEWSMLETDEGDKRETFE